MNNICNLNDGLITNLYLSSSYSKGGVSFLKTQEQDFKKLHSTGMVGSHNLLTFGLYIFFYSPFLFIGAVFLVNDQNLILWPHAKL